MAKTLTIKYYPDAVAKKVEEKSIDIAPSFELEQNYAAKISGKSDRLPGVYPKGLGIGEMKLSPKVPTPFGSRIGVIDIVEKGTLTAATASTPAFYTYTETLDAEDDIAYWTMISEQHYAKYEITVA